EGEAAEAEHCRERDQERHRALVVLGEGRSEERPDLPEDDRQRDDQGGPEADPDRGRERLDRAERGRLLQVVRQRSVQPVEDPTVEDVRDDERGPDRQQTDDEAGPQLAEMLDERDLLAVAKPPREGPHGPSWRAACRRWTAAGSRARRPCR